MSYVPSHSESHLILLDLATSIQNQPRLDLQFILEKIEEAYSLGRKDNENTSEN